MKTNFKHKQSVVVLDTENVRNYDLEGESIGQVIKLDLSGEDDIPFNKGGFKTTAIGNTYYTNYCNTDVRKATAAEIRRGCIKGIKRFKVIKKFNIGSYDVKFIRKGRICREIKVGCQSVDKKLFMAIGKKAGWITRDKSKGVK